MRQGFWVFDLALHIGLGWDYRGRKVTKGAVVYCALEGAVGFNARAEAFRCRFSHVFDDGDCLEDNLAGFFVMPSPMTLVADHERLVKAISALEDGWFRPEMVVIDTLNRSLAGSESRDEDMAAYVRAADAIRDAFDCVVIIVHHSGIDASRPRGHTSLTGAADAQIAVKRDAADNVIVTVEYMKDGPEGDTFTSRLESVEVGTDEDGDPITSCVIVPAEGGEAGTTSRVTGAAKVALDLLWRGITDAGIVPPASNHVPPGIRTIPVSLWRRYCDEGTVAESDKPDSRQKAFVRASKKLQSLGAIGIWNDQVWPTGQARQRQDKH